MDDKQYAYDQLRNGLDSASAVIKLEFGVSTGAVAFFVHAIFEKSEGPLLVGILTAATFCFGVSAIVCLRALRNFVVVKTALTLVIAAPTEARDDAVKDFESEFKTLREGYEVGNWFFYVGIALSVTLLIAKFVMELVLKFCH
jgi:hypothetical protein